MARGRAVALVLVVAVGACRKSGAGAGPAPLSAAELAARRAADSAARAARTPVRPPVTLPIGEGKVTVEARAGGRVAVTASEPQKMALEFAPPSVTRFVTESSQLLARRRLRRERDNIKRAMLDEPGADGGALSFSRRVRGRLVMYRFFFADNVGGGFPITVGKSEAKALLQAMREAAAALTPKPARQARVAKRRSGRTQSPGAPTGSSASGRTRTARPSPAKADTTKPNSPKAGTASPPQSTPTRMPSSVRRP